MLPNPKQGSADRVGDAILHRYEYAGGDIWEYLTQGSSATLVIVNTFGHPALAPVVVGTIKPSGHTC
jgi:hypothetical protein